LPDVTFDQLAGHAVQSAQIAVGADEGFDAMPPRGQLARQIGADEPRSPSEETIHALLNRHYTKGRPAIFQAKSGEKKKSTSKRTCE
jgi:hypothetical protein